MKVRNLILLAVLVLTACSNAPSTLTGVPAGTPTPSLKDPVVNVTPAPDVETDAKAFLDNWVNIQFPAMYAQLTNLSKDAWLEADFVNRLREVNAILTLKQMSYQIKQSFVKNPSEAQVAYKVTYDTVLVGELTRDTVMNLTLQDGSWKVAWDETLILPELGNDNQLRMEITTPTRGNIYDKTGDVLVSETEAVAIGIIPERLASGTKKSVNNTLGKVLDRSGDAISKMYENAGTNWYVGIGDSAMEDMQGQYNNLQNMGVQLAPYTGRYYWWSSASHVTGYVQPIPAEQALDYEQKGYKVDERVGISGLELWGQDYLSGQRGASLYVVDGSGNIVSRLGNREAKASASIYTTLDARLQYMTMLAMRGGGVKPITGAAIVMERDTGKLLAMVSAPNFNPNVFNPNNANYGSNLYEFAVTDPRVPQLNRATKGQYPLGSVFKIITMAAALESKVFTPESTYDCQHTYTELQGYTLYDWTYAHEDPPSGLLTLPEGLMRSCNPWFYHIGYTMYNLRYTEEIAKMARAFGLGEKTGIEGVEEVAGDMPAPASIDEAVQLAIGQGKMLVTPLQVVRFIAALGNGGTLYKPQIIDRVTDLDNKPVVTFKPEAQGTLPISDATAKVIRDAMYEVVNNERGTAYYAFRRLGVPVYGKTGTAQTSLQEPHAWFAAYTDAKNGEKPDIAVVVVVENGGEGSEVAAPIVRRILEDYFNGQPNWRYPWESAIYIDREPTPTPGPETLAP